MRNETINGFFKHKGKMNREHLPYQAVFFSFDIQTKADQFLFYGVQGKVDSSGYQGVIESVQEFFTYQKDQRNYVVMYNITMTTTMCMPCSSNKKVKYDSTNCDDGFKL